MSLLGRSSYAFYLVHMLVIDHLKPILIPDVGYLACLLIVLAVTIILAIGLFLLYEEPLNMFLRRKLTKKYTSSHEEAAWLPVQKP